MALEGKMVGFPFDGGTANGYLVEPEGDGPFPAVIVIQEWWGLNDHIKDIAGRFAKEGYAALAPDLYDGVVTKDAEQAGKLMQALDQDKALKSLDGAVDYLVGQANIRADRIGVTGFCMGGTFALLMACRNPKIKASVPFYGDVPQEEALKNLLAPVLFFAGDQDQWINADKWKRLEAGLANFEKEGEVKVYRGAGHAFFNDTRPDAYNKEAAEDAWARTLHFFEVYLKPKN
jgi:carboxymethylenebutenolidase